LSSGGDDVTEHTPTVRQVFEDLAAEHLSRPQAAQRTMFGRDCLTTDGRMVAFFHDDRLALKLPPATATALLDSGKAVRPHMGERPMRHWVCVPLPEDPAEHHHWHQLLADARAYIGDTRPDPRSTGSRQIVGRPTAGSTSRLPSAAERFARLAEHFAHHSGVTIPGAASGPQGFGSGALKVHGSIFAMLRGDRLVLKLPRDRVDDLVTTGAADPFTAGKTRRMKEWATITTDDESSWQALAREAFDFVGSRPGGSRRSDRNQQS
jgi:TfoX/Sxy family transcriptional regulator of competence genes